MKEILLSIATTATTTSVALTGIGLPRIRYNELIKVYEDYKKNKKNKLSVFLD